MALDLSAIYWDLEPDFECLEMERSMSHHRDRNMPQALHAKAIAELENTPDMITINSKIAELTERIGGRPRDHMDLVHERAKLYTNAAKMRRAKLRELISNWWKTSYSEYIAGNEFTERDPTCLFDICSKYMPERRRLQENLFKEASLDSEIGRQCLQDMVNICVSQEKVAYYPGNLPTDGKCPMCSTIMSRCVSFSKRDIMC